MSDNDESPAEKTEKTIEGIVYSLAAYFTTLAALALPVILPRQFFQRLDRLRSRKLLAPPLLFLSISAFLFSITVAIIDSPEFLDVRDTLSGFIKSRASLDISITQLLFTILPIFLWVLLVSWFARLLVAEKRRRRQLSNCFCYI